MNFTNNFIQYITPKLWSLVLFLFFHAILVSLSHAQCIVCPTTINNATPSVLELEFNPYPPAQQGSVDIYVGQNDPRNGRYQAYQVSPSSWAIYQVPAAFCCDDLQMTLKINEKQCYIDKGSFAGCGPLAPPVGGGDECEDFLEHCQLEIEDFVHDQLANINNSGCAKWEIVCSTTEPIRRQGPVGIGLSRVPSGYDLAVKGGIVTSAVTVRLCSNGDWCDYVFEPDYPLTPIKEVAAFIEEKGHLPQMPSAARIEQDKGFELRSIKIQQLQKIEEAYLYALQLKQRVDGFQTRVEQLKAENKKLREEQ